MTKIAKIAILIDRGLGLSFELEEIKRAFEKVKISIKFFYESDSIISYNPDCVIVTSPQDAKLTPFPTYGLINLARDDYLELPRFLRNILTYDGYLTVSPRLKQMLEDIMFGARKLGSGILWLDLYPALTEFTPRTHYRNKVLIVEKDFAHSKFRSAIQYLLDKIDNCYVVTFSAMSNAKQADKFLIVKNLAEFDSVLSDFDIAICLESGDQQEQLIKPTVIKAISSSMITIAHETEGLKECFSDSLYYIPQDTSIEQMTVFVRKHIQAISANYENAINKSRYAHEVFAKTFSFDKLITEFIQFHEKTLIKKGYVPHPDKKVEAALPSVSYIIRTGGKHRPFLERTLNCLVAQQYPDLRVIFVTHVQVPYLDEIIDKYSTLKFKVVSSIKSRRSEAIRDGMAAVDTDLFGLFDDDDEIFPNHVRSLVKTMQYNTNRDWRGKISMVYSGSLHVDDTESVFERVEFHDYRLINKNEKRAIEHFKFYSSVLMSQHAWFMPNGWLARADLIDEELLIDPELDTCEDLYFELQFAQRAHFAFSVEVTAVHNFHHLGNSTNEDSKKHLPDTQRIAMRNFSRVFPPDAQYDTPYNIVGRLSQHDCNQIRYQDYIGDALKPKTELLNSFYPFRRYESTKLKAALPASAYAPKSTSILKVMLLSPIKVISYINKFRKFDQYKRRYYLTKFKQSIEREGLIATASKMISFFNKPGIDTKLIAKPRSTNRHKFRELYFKFKLILRQAGLIQAVKTSLSKVFK